jgi:hypothetical protein
VSRLCLQLAYGGDGPFGRPRSEVNSRVLQEELLDGVVADAGVPARHNGDLRSSLALYIMRGSNIAVKTVGTFPVKSGMSRSGRKAGGNIRARMAPIVGNNMFLYSGWVEFYTLSHLGGRPTRRVCARPRRVRSEIIGMLIRGRKFADSAGKLSADSALRNRIRIRKKRSLKTAASHFREVHNIGFKLQNTQSNMA